MSYRTKDKALLLGLMVGGAEPVLTGGDAIRVAGLKSKPTFAMITNNYHRGTTNKAVDEAGAGYNQVTFTRWLTGAGVVGSVPRDDLLLRGSGLLPTAVAGAAGLAVTAASTMSVTLAAASPLLAANPRGLVVEIDGGAGVGQRRTVSTYDDATKVVSVSGKWDVQPDNTSTIAILQGTLYTPRLDAGEQIALAEMNRNRVDKTKSRRTRCIDAMATWSGKISTGNPMELSYTVRGILPANPDDTDWPEPLAYGVEAATAPKLLAADVHLGGARFRFSELTFDLAASLDQPDDPGAELGYATAEINEHSTGGRLVPERLDLATRDLMRDFRAGTPRDLSLVWGEPGNGFALLSEIKHSAVPDEQDVRGRLGDVVTYRAHRETDWFHLFAF